MATPVPPKPWKAEYAKSGRSSCKSCKSAIDKDNLRLGKMVVATQFDGFMPLWHHAGCILKKANQIKTFDDVEGLDLLRWEDQQKIRKYVEGLTSATPNASNDESTIEVSQTSRASCKRCGEKIMKGMVRISTKLEGKGSKGLTWHHINCFREIFPSLDIKKVSGWDDLPLQDKETISAVYKKDPSTAKRVQGTKEEALQKATSRETKRRKFESDQKISKNSISDGKESSGSNTDLERKLEEQNRALWAIKDELKKQVTTQELREMLEVNEQDSAGSEYDLRERCADGMLFGVLGKCPLCSGSLHYSGAQYRCHGYLSAWSKCSYSTTEPVRLKKKWGIPEGTCNEYLLKWFKSQKAKKPNRVLPPQSSSNYPGNISSSKQSQSSTSERLEDLKIALTGESRKAVEDLKQKLEEHGGKVHAKVNKDTSCLIACGAAQVSDPEIKKARRMKVPIVREDYLGECIEKQKKLPFELYKVEVSGENMSGMVTVKVKGRSAVHETSGLQDSGHILDDGKSIYNTTLNMSDLSTGINSYYILQVIEEDKGPDCYVFRKWGRVGNDKIGGSKLEEMSKSECIMTFKRLFLEKTGNPWEAWEQGSFEKQPGRFCPLDIDYGVKPVSKKKDPNNRKSNLASQVQSLMKMLFNVETYRAAMLEFQIDMTEMPLGKLSKKSIHKGFEALTEIQNLLNNSNGHEPTVRESLLVDASNRFFTLIPSIHPHVIRGEDDLKAKVKMLDALQDIEIASRLVGFDEENDETLDEKYMKLQCKISPLPHDSEDFQMIEKYLLTTHAPTHEDWSLELEEVFALEREGEFDKYATYRGKLKNKMLLWHGSRLTNFVGILNQGLRIAPPEAPVTGYMFGKGVYFADLVSKSAQYCYVDKKDPVGLMLLSEVALGEMYELKKATYMEKPPKGKHSTKGLGKTVPLESEFVKWRDVTVPCGKPVPSSVRASELMYNEYIVYNTAQIKMQFLLKVRFHHKR
ncbi:poly [ADP-ribose] polymerase 1 [Dendrobium catenatum]|uniref:poly [ADP-ribose] polymerase 1 n=1 Tax=Dendrobium catenatum TaxID=906689 RepID=UPI0009F57227|nr:poly [ADP-ribose] polymerase 1 [Dendrobium catenatum]